MAEEAEVAHKHVHHVLSFGSFDMSQEGDPKFQDLVRNAGY